jgi:hypothetical protein
MRNLSREKMRDPSAMPEIQTGKHAVKCRKYRVIK